MYEHFKNELIFKLDCMECAYDKTCQTYFMSKTCVTKLAENKEEQENENDRQNV